MFIIQFTFHRKIESITRIFVGFNLLMQDYKGMQKYSKNSFFFSKKKTYFLLEFFLKIKTEEKQEKVSKEKRFHTNSIISWKLIILDNKERVYFLVT